MGRDVEAQSNASEHGKSRRVFTSGCGVVVWHAGAPAGKEDNHVRGRGSCARLLHMGRFVKEVNH